MGSTDRTPYWLSSVYRPEFPQVRGDVEVDVVVVGGGITGLTCALALRRAGRSVAVVEAGRVGDGTTGRTSAHLAWIPDACLQTLRSKFGTEGATLATNAHLLAIDHIEQTARAESIECGFARVPGFLYAEKGQDTRVLEQEMDVALALGRPAERTSAIPAPFAVEAAVRFDGQGQLHPIAYLVGLAGALVRAGGQVFEGARVTEVEDGAPCRVQTRTGAVAARHVVLATHTPIGAKMLLHHARVEAYRSYVLAAEIGDRLPGALLWDTADPYHYTRGVSSGGRDLLIVGGGDHKTGHDEDTEAAYARLEKYVRERYQVRAIVDAWSGQLYEPADALPYVGRSPGSEHVSVATGFSGNGLTWGTAAGLLLADEILERENPLADLFTPSRVKPIASAKHVATQQAEVTMALLAGALGPAETREIDEVPRGEGRLVRVGLKKLAVFRDDAGTVHAMSSTCTHAGCTVRFNHAERSWDCPCHGGRYTAEGEVIEGPPVERLAPVDVGGTR